MCFSSTNGTEFEEDVVQQQPRRVQLTQRMRQWREGERSEKASMRVSNWSGETKVVHNTQDETLKGNREGSKTGTRDDDDDDDDDSDDGRESPTARLAEEYVRAKRMRKNSFEKKRASVYGHLHRHPSLEPRPPAETESTTGPGALMTNVEGKVDDDGWEPGGRYDMSVYGKPNEWRRYSGGERGGSFGVGGGGCG